MAGKRTFVSELATFDARTESLEHSMLEGIAEHRIANMSDQERRWLDNVKKALYHSDVAVKEGRHKDHAFAEMCKAIDSAKTLRRSLRGEDTSGAKNKDRFMEFIDQEVPTPSRGGLDIELLNARDGKKVRYSFSGLIYAIRCVVLHENENLDAAERPDFHVQIDWNMRGQVHSGCLINDVLIIDGWFFWNRLREVILKFVTGIEATEALSKNEYFCFSINAPLGSVKPGQSTQVKPN